MKNLVRPLAALVVTVFVGGVAFAATVGSGFGNESHGAQIGYDSFNLSVKKRMEATRVGSVGRTFSAAAFSSDGALAAAPSSRSETIYGSRRQLDCVYYSGFTVWGDLYQTWAAQRTRGGDDGFKYRITGPALGFDWTNGQFTVGAATTYGWAKIKSREYNNDRKNRMWALTLYGQYDTQNFYVNATAGYAYNRYTASGGGFFTSPTAIGGMGYNDRYSGDAWNFNGEFGYKFHFGGFKVVPNVGLRYFHDRVGSFNENNSAFHLQGSPRSYHVLELPVGVNLSYEIAAGGSIIVPRLRAAWIPELARKRGGWSGTVYDSTGTSWGVGETTARRSRHSFQVGAGIEAKITKAISAHVDYTCNFRSKYYEHHWNLGLGFTF